MDFVVCHIRNGFPFRVNYPTLFTYTKRLWGLYKKTILSVFYDGDLLPSQYHDLAHTYTYVHFELMNVLRMTLIS